MKKLILAVAVAVGLSACNNKANEQEKQAAIAAVKDSIRLDSFKRAEAVILQAKRDKQIADSAATAALASRRSLSGSGRSSSSRSSGSSSSNSSYGGTVATQKKQGWSDAAKGATIGGVAGAVGGALIDKKKGRGAIIGGVVGAGTGYVIGRGEDRKSGRVQPKNN